MKITILGAGNMGCANAADLTLKGHEVTLVKTSHSMHNETFNYVCAHNNEITLWQEGEEQTARIHAVTTDLSSVATADLVYQRPRAADPAHRAAAAEGPGGAYLPGLLLHRLLPETLPR